MSENTLISNIENFTKLISSCLGYGARYQPSNNKIKIPNLQNVLAQSKLSIKNINTLAQPRTNTINARLQLFNQLPSYASRIVSALSACENVHQTTVNDAMIWIHKIRGVRVGKKVLDPSPNSPKQISVSQRSYVNQAEFFSQLIAFVLSQTEYTPNETELQEPALHTFETQLHQANLTAVDANTPWLNALIARDHIMFDPITGLIDLALTTKKYVRSVEAISLAEYKQISGLKFTRPRKKK